MFVEIYVPFHKDGSEAHLLCLAEGIFQQGQPIALALVVRGDADGAEGQYRDDSAVIGENLRLGEHHVAHKDSVGLHHEIQLGDKVGIAAVAVKYIVLGATGPIDIPEGFSGKVFYIAEI